MRVTARRGPHGRQLDVPQRDMSKHRPIADDPTVDQSHLLKVLGLVSVCAENKRGIDLTQTKTFNRMNV